MKTCKVCGKETDQPLHTCSGKATETGTPKFQLTEEESAKIDELLRWQDCSNIDEIKKQLTVALATVDELTKDKEIVDAIECHPLWRITYNSQDAEWRVYYNGRMLASETTLRTAIDTAIKGEQ